MHRRDAGGRGVAAGSAEGFEERDHPLSLCCVGQPPAAGPEIVRHVLRVAGAGDHRGYGLVAEEIFEEELAPASRIEISGPFQRILPPQRAEEPIAGKRQVGQLRPRPGSPASPPRGRRANN
jgi:hypothetical protein